MSFDPDKALQIARESVHCYFCDTDSPHTDSHNYFPDSSHVRLLQVKDNEIDKLLKNNPY